MGIIARQNGKDYVIASDRNTGDAKTNRPPKGKPSEQYEVWTGSAWSAEMGDAKKFETSDDVDEYVRANFSRVTGQG